MRTMASCGGTSSPIATSTTTTRRCATGRLGLPVADEVEHPGAAGCATSQLGRGPSLTSYPELASNPSKRQSGTCSKTPDPMDPLRRRGRVRHRARRGRARRRIGWCCSTPTPGSCRRTALRTSEADRLAARPDIEHLLIVLDLCYAGDDRRRSRPLRRRLPVDLAGTGQCDPKRRRPCTGALTTAIAEFVAELASPIGEKFDHGPLPAGRPVHLDAMQTNLGDGQRLAPLYPGCTRGGQPVPAQPPLHPRTERPVQPARRDLALRPG